MSKDYDWKEKPWFEIENPCLRIYAFILVKTLQGINSLIGPISRWFLKHVYRES